MPDRSWTIYLAQDKHLDYNWCGSTAAIEARMAELARAPRMREWWDVMDPMQRPVEGRAPGDWWANMEEVFHT